MTDSTAVHEPLGTDVRNLLRIAVPISLGSLVQFLVVLTDNFFLSRAGELQINGAGNAGLIYLTFTMVIMGGGVGIQILVSRFKGQQHPAQMAQAFRTGRLCAGFGNRFGSDCPRRECPWRLETAPPKPRRQGGL